MLVRAAGTRSHPHTVRCFGRKSIEFPNDLERLHGITCFALVKSSNLALLSFVFFSFHSLSVPPTSGPWKAIWHESCRWGKAVFGMHPAVFGTSSKLKNQTCLIVWSCLTQSNAPPPHVYLPLSRRRHFQNLLYDRLKLNVNKAACSVFSW